MAKRKEITYETNINGCHVCTSHYSVDGYPHFYRKQYGGVKIVRYLWQEKYGRIGKDKFLLHSCDDRGCINLKHIRVGSAKDNTRDAIDRGRLACGSRNGFSRLTEDQAKVIKHSKKTEMQLAKQFNINRATVGYIRRGQTWKHI